ncbi:LOW QUALITY PROTEIN: hypothetical protein PanWU01x14_040500 [Parasponia andersonii]|uniref:Uncharacterized protein n=1 Tax=Parasponia andersonii TaxID=3476 RepID=A0A2P5DR76_PARAD|nr:LOW QUALITY PROTEIN: hypothetical protein PanWU01x14_040500 [Parasponia andersonii]
MGSSCFFLKPNYLKTITEYEILMTKLPNFENLTKKKTQIWNCRTQSCLKLKSKLDQTLIRKPQDSPKTQIWNCTEINLKE